MLRALVFAVVIAAISYGVYKAIPQPDYGNGRFSPDGVRVFSETELKQFDGSDADKPLLLCILGEVYDVSAGAKYYGKEHGYNVFLAQDASRAFHTGEFDKVIDDVRDLDVMAVADIIGWRDFYRKHKTYHFVGVLAGLYYDASGAPTNALRDVDHMGNQAENAKAHEEKQMKEFPSCIMKHDGTTRKTDISCPTDNEARYPRLLKWIHKGSLKEAARCACFTGRELSRGVTIGSAEVYEGCAPQDKECTIQQ